MIFNAIVKNSRMPISRLNANGTILNFKITSSSVKKLLPHFSLFFLSTQCHSSSHWNSSFCRTFTSLFQGCLTDEFQCELEWVDSSDGSNQCLGVQPGKSSSSGGSGNGAVVRSEQPRSLDVLRPSSRYPDPLCESPSQDLLASSEAISPAPSWTQVTSSDCSSALAERRPPRASTGRPLSSSSETSSQPPP